MARHMALGHKGERLAQEYLVKLNYAILETNWRFNKGEIDIIAQQENVVVFVEVKTRTNTAFGKPEQSISKAKQEKLSTTATEYLEQIKHLGEFRFDVIAILIKDENSYEMEHFVDAFFPSDID